MTPKLHLFEHLCQVQVVLWGNPSFWWTYADEDLVGLAIDMAQNCHPTSLAITMLYKWLIVHFDHEEDDLDQN